MVMPLAPRPSTACAASVLHLDRDCEDESGARDNVWVFSVHPVIAQVDPGFREVARLETDPADPMFYGWHCHGAR
jgi:hypothetical protein